MYCAPARWLKMCWMALLSLANWWGTWKKTQNETYSYIFKLKNLCMCVKQVNWLRGDCALQLKQNDWWRASNVISKLWAGQATKKAVGESLCWVYGSTLGWRNEKLTKYRNEGCLDMFRLKNAKLNWKKCSSVQTETKIVDCKAGVTSSVLI